MELNKQPREVRNEVKRTKGEEEKVNVGHGCVHAHLLKSV